MRQHSSSDILCNITAQLHFLLYVLVFMFVWAQELPTLSVKPKLFGPLMAGAAVPLVLVLRQVLRQVLSYNICLWLITRGNHHVLSDSAGIQRQHSSFNLTVLPYCPRFVDKAYAEELRKNEAHQLCCVSF